MPNEFAGSVENIECHFIFGRGLEIIIDDRARRRVVADRLAFVELLRVMQAQRSFRLIKNRLRLGRLRCDLSQRRDVIEHPKRTAMGCNNEIVLLDHQIVDGRDRQIQLERLPVCAVIERNKHAQLGAGVKQAGFFRIFAHGVHISAVRNAVCDRRPGFAQISRFENVWLEIIEFMSIHRDISAAAVARRRINNADRAPRGHLRRDVGPMLSVISGHLHQTIVRAGPERSFFYRRFRKRKNRVVIFNRRDVVRERTAARLLFAFIVAREIAADLRPALAVIGRFENALRCGVKRVRVVRRKHKRRGPLETMDEIGRAMSRAVEGEGTHVLHFFFVFVVANDVAFAV